MPKKKKKTPKDYAQIQFRASAGLAQWLQEFGKSRGLTANSCAKHLAILARFEMSARHMKPMLAIAESMGGPRSFESVCQHVIQIVENAEKDRVAKGDKPYRNEERKVVIVNYINQLSEQFRGRALPEIQARTMGEYSVTSEEVIGRILPEIQAGEYSITPEEEIENKVKVYVRNDE